MKKTAEMLVLLLGLPLSLACSFSSEMVQVDGSSTVYPITEAVAEEFRYESPGIRVIVGVSGTGGGFQRFLRGETDISNASRPIKESELKLVKNNDIGFIELPVAYDGISVVVNSQNDWCSSMTVNELRRLWEPSAQRKITRWSQVRSGWPNREIHLFGPGVDSGTYDYFTQAIVGEEGASRGDFTSSEDDNVLVQGVTADELALAYFGFAYYEENRQRLNLVPIDDENPDNGQGPILPTPETIADGTYQPLSRPVFIYVREKAASRPEVEQFVEFYLRSAPKLVRQVGYISLSDRAYELARERFRRRITGSLFGGEGSQVGVSLEDVLMEQMSEK